VQKSIKGSNRPIAEVHTDSDDRLFIGPLLTVGVFIWQTFEPFERQLILKFVGNLYSRSSMPLPRSQNKYVNWLILNNFKGNRVMWQVLCFEV
jgi:hypothetical protein